ncbi:nuclear receptor subfamily 6 group A member 1-like [Heptranchias perlo]|uniref:nuclear receptor subfamily 6 group A member 1-like n=1 Tax=Heptranchias perlo TaxID=212740 RepID=UPI0035597698
MRPQRNGAPLRNRPLPWRLPRHQFLKALEENIKSLKRFLHYVHDHATVFLLLISSATSSHAFFVAKAERFLWSAGYSISLLLLTPASSNSREESLKRDDRSDRRVCLICGDRATGLHYGITSCEGCKGFFKRSIFNKRIYRCIRNKNCTMSRKQRNQCQYCRLMKCLQMGMNRKAIREDGMPGGRNKTTGPVYISEEAIQRIMAGEELDDEGNSSGNSSGESDPSSPNNGRRERNISPDSQRSIGLNGYTALTDSCLISEGPAVIQYLPPCFAYSAHSLLSWTETHSFNLHPQSLLQQLLQAEETKQLKIPVLIQSRCDVTPSNLMALLCQLADEILFWQIMWIKKLPFFKEVLIKEYTCLLAASWHELVLLRAFTSRDWQALGALCGIVEEYSLSRDTVHRCTDETVEVAEQLIYLFRKFRQLAVTEDEYVCMKVINFLSQDTKGFSNVAHLEQLKKSYLNVCQEYTVSQYPEQPSRFPDLMTCLTVIHSISDCIMQDGCPSGWVYKPDCGTCTIINVNNENGPKYI